MQTLFRSVCCNGYWQGLLRLWWAAMRTGCSTITLSANCWCMKCEKLLPDTFFCLLHNAWHAMLITNVHCLSTVGGSPLWCTRPAILASMHRYKYLEWGWQLCSVCTLCSCTLWVLCNESMTCTISVFPYMGSRSIDGMISCWLPGVHWAHLFGWSTCLLRWMLSLGLSS